MSDRDDVPGKPKASEPSRSYDVGYAKPPVHSRFARGKSGNPRGRPRGNTSTRTLLERALSAPVTITEGGKVSTIDQRTALFKSLVAKAIKGDTRCAALVIKLMEQEGLNEDKEDQIMEIRWVIAGSQSGKED